MVRKTSISSASGHSLGESFLGSRSEAGITQEELAAASEVDARTIRTIESNGRFSARTRQKVLDGLNKLRRIKGYPRVRFETNGGRTRLCTQSPTWLDHPDREWFSQYHGPGALVTADYRVVPFHGARSLEQRQRLVNWCLDRERFRIKVYKGAGGIGKTRLAVELCRVIAGNANSGWTAGFAELLYFPESSSPWDFLPGVDRPTLVVVDYAGEESKTKLISQLLLHMPDCPAPKLRLLFLERNDLWLDRLYENRAAREVLLGPLLSRSGEDEAHSLAPVASSFAERVESFRIAAKAFGKKLGLKAGAVHEADLRGPLFNRVLFIHIQALLSVLGSTGHGKSAMLRHLLGRESDYWRKRLQSVGLSTELLPAVERAILQLSLLNGAPNEATATKLIKETDLLHGETPVVLRQIVRLLRECYPREDGGIGPLQPDELKHYLQSRFA